jgi:predicted MPP superfamily phosphohydrolase
MSRRRRSPGRYVRFLQLITAGALAPLAVAVFHLMAPLGVGAAGAAALTAAAVVLAPIEARIRFGFEDTLRARWLSRFVVLFDMLWMATVLAPVTTLIAGLGLFALGRASLGAACINGVVGAAVVAAYGVLIRRRWVIRRRVEVEIAGLPAELDGYRIAHLSDLHIGSIDRREEALAWADAANALRPDAIVITGDILTTGTAYHDDAVEVLAALRARDGVYACLGNHDYYGEDALCRKLAARDVRVLRNEGVALGSGKLFLAGVEDMWRGSPDLDAALRDRPSGAPVVLLAHNPEYFPVAERASIALTLSGHTHAGQLAVPFLVSRATLSHFVTRWPAGLYREGDAQIFVHAGLGTTGPAIRLGAAPEVVEIVLRARRLV